LCTQGASVVSGTFAGLPAVSDPFKDSRAPCNTNARELRGAAIRETEL